MKITLVGDIFPADEFLSVGFGIRSQFEATKGERWKIIFKVSRKIRIL